MTDIRQRKFSRRALFGSVATLGVAAAGSGWALDRFVIEHVEVAAASDYTGLPGTQSATSAAATASASAAASASETSTDGVIDGTTYTSSDRSITITSHTSGSGSSALVWYVADVVVSDATAIRSAFANDQFGTNITAMPSEIAQQAGALFAINGDYYGFRSSGIVIRDGVAFRDEPARQGLALYTDGRMVAYDEKQTSAAQLIADGVWQTLSFGPAVVVDGVVPSGVESVEVDTNVGNHSIQGSQPRTGIGMIEANHFVFVVVDGRSEGYSNGITMTVFGQLFVDLGATVAYNLDGGGSSVMLFNDELVNNPLGKGEVRATSDIIWIGK